MMGHTFRREDGIPLQIWVTNFELRDKFVTMCVPLRYDPRPLSHEETVIAGSRKSSIDRQTGKWEDTHPTPPAPHTHRE